MLWLKSMILTIQMAGLVGLLGISSDVKDFYKVENITAVRFTNVCPTDTNMYV